MNRLFFFFAFLILLLGSCSPFEETEFEGDAPRIAFSTDTVMYDTLITRLVNITKRVRLYNLENKTITIDELSLGLGEASNYDLIVNGKRGRRHENIQLMGQDSLYVLIEIQLPAASDYPNLPFLVKDSIVARAGVSMAEVKLLAYGQDAVFLLSNSYLTDCDAVWTNEKPYVVDQGVGIAEGCTLTIQKGTKVFMGRQSVFLVDGTLIIEGDTLSYRVVFEGTRLDADYENVAGQWYGIVFSETSAGNQLNGTLIRNAVYGISHIKTSADADTVPEISLFNVQIENMADRGITAINSDMNMRNTFVYNCLSQTLFIGGASAVVAEHCGFVNYNYEFSREDPSVVCSYTIEIPTVDGTLLIDGPPEFHLRNSLIWGSLEEEMYIDVGSASIAHFSPQHSLMRTKMSGLAVFGNIVNEDPLFVNSSARDYHLAEGSPAIDQGMLLGIGADIEGVLRVGTPDMGAFEWSE